MKNFMELPFPTKNDNQKSSDQPFDLLPHHLWEEIMAWLPPRSLIRCKSVKKSWRAHIASLLHDPSFAAKHLRNAVGPARGRNMVFSLRKPTPIELSTVAFDGGRIARECGFTSFDVPNSHLAARMAKPSHCDGLVFIESWHGQAMICNPALNEWKTVSAPRCQTRSWLLRSGIGYDSVAGEYKIVRFETDRLAHAATLQARVYSFISDSWTLMGTKGLQGFDRFLRAMNGTMIFSKGRCYSAVFAPEYSIISFDFAQEEFAVVPSPDGLKRQGRNNVFTAWKGGVAIISCAYPKMYVGPIEIWAALTEEDGKSSVITASCWTKKHCISSGPFWEAVAPCDISFWTEEELVGESKDRRLISYNLRSGEFGFLTIPGVLEKASSRDPYWPIPCVESLISVRPDKKKKIV